jgi:hypothetical protein
MRNRQIVLVGNATSRTWTSCKLACVPR